MKNLINEITSFLENDSIYEDIEYSSTIDAAINRILDFRNNTSIYEDMEILDPVIYDNGIKFLENLKKFPSYYLREINGCSSTSDGLTIDFKDIKDIEIYAKISLDQNKKFAKEFYSIEFLIFNISNNLEYRIKKIVKH
jgi:hypothetical protein